MPPFVYSGKKKIRLSSKYFRDADLLYPQKALQNVSYLSLRDSLKEYFRKQRNLFQNKRVCVVIPDRTREFHARKILPPLSAELQKITAVTVFLISLGLHRRFSREELRDFLGESFVKKNRVLQHECNHVRSLGSVHGVPATLNRELFESDMLFTVGVVEPHLYAGFSGGIKCISIGLAGKRTILKTHSVRSLSRKGVKVANIRANPFQDYLWEVSRLIKIPVCSLNIVNNLKKEMAYYSIGDARRSFLNAVKEARRLYSFPVSKPYDLLVVGCDFPKDQGLYQASRLFNAVLDQRPLVRKGGVIMVAAGLNDPAKSNAERNFERILKRRQRPRSYAFTKPGEHRAAKVLEAARHARLCMVTPHIPKGRFPDIHYCKDFREAARWAGEHLGEDFRAGVIPLGFSFIPGGRTMSGK